MNVIVSGKQIKVTEPLREYAKEKAQAIQRYFDHIIETDITIGRDKHKHEGQTFHVDMTVWANGTVLRSVDSHEDVYAALNGAIGKIERQLKKYKQKVRENPKRKGAKAAAPLKEAGRRKTKLTAAELEAPHSHTVLDVDLKERSSRVVRTQSFAMKPMSVDEAVLQLETLGQPFMMFSNAETNEVNVVYRRSDGNIGHIEPRAGA